MSAEEGQPSGVDRIEAIDRSWMVWTAAGIVGIWIAVVVISIFSPDLVSGSQQERLPLVAFITWIWGGIGTVAVLWAMGALRGSEERKPLWIGFSAVTLAIWLVATILSIALPVFETGSDATQLPFGALFAPLAAALLTGLAGVVVNTLRRTPAAD